MVSLVVLLLISGDGAIGPYIYPHPFDEQNIEFTNQTPSLAALVSDWTIWGGISSRENLDGGENLINGGIVGAIVSLVIGVLYGGISPVLRRTCRMISMMRIVEILVGMPYISEWLLSYPWCWEGHDLLLIALCITSWTDLARIIERPGAGLKESETFWQPGRWERLLFRSS